LQGQRSPGVPSTRYRGLQTCAIVEPRLNKQSERGRAHGEQGTGAAEHLIGGRRLTLAEYLGAPAATPILDIDPHRPADRRDLIDGSPADLERR